MTPRKNKILLLLVTHVNSKMTKLRVKYSFLTASVSGLKLLKFSTIKSLGRNNLLSSVGLDGAAKSEPLAKGLSIGGSITAHFFDLVEIIRVEV